MKKLESGRSMVEMLGVLAIIGVLSIGGIAGYTVAMNRYRANEILDAAAKLSIIAMTKGGNGAAATLENDLEGLDLTAFGVSGMTATPYSDGTVTVTIEETTAGMSDGVEAALESVGGDKVDGTNIYPQGETADDATAINPIVKEETPK